VVLSVSVEGETVAPWKAQNFPIELSEEFPAIAGLQHHLGSIDAASICIADIDTLSKQMASARSTFRHAACGRLRKIAA
jgi:hypothetical protein